MTHRITLVPGDGIGPEVAQAARQVIAAAGIDVDWDVQEAGAAVMEGEGTPLPDRVLESIAASRTALKGPVTTPVGTGFRSVNVALRQELDLFAAVRPSRHYPSVPTRHPGVDLVVIRENTEDLYRGIEFRQGSEEVAGLARHLQRLAGYPLPQDAGVTVKPISIAGTRRIVRFALEFARQHGRKKVTVGHKANIMRFSDGVFLRTALEIDRTDYPDVQLDAMEIDELAMWLATGGLGLAPGANLGWEYAVFEPVHGSAPDLAGKGVANPIAMILTGALMLRHLSEDEAAARIENAVAAVLEDGRARTPDLGGTATTREVAEAIAARLG